MCPVEVPADGEHRPFCSARCQHIDLHNWLSEIYVLSRPMNPDEFSDAVMDSPDWPSDLV